MNADLVARFESCTLPPGEFHHEQHLYVAWSYLRELPLAAAAERFIANLKRYAASVGAAGLYHDTITWAYLVLINERLCEGGLHPALKPAEAGACSCPDWTSFREANADLFAKDCLQRYYRAETLQSERARRVFLLPDAMYEGLR